MLPLIAAGAAVAGAGIGYLGGSATNSANAEQNHYNRMLAEHMQQKDMNFQEWMSNTAVRRRAEDMRMAGINPLLAVTQGQGAQGGSSSGSVPSNIPMQNAAGNLSEGLSRGTNSAMEAKRVEAEVSQKDVQNKLIETQEHVAQAQKHLYQNQSAKASFDAVAAQDNSKATAKEAEARIKEAELASRQAEIDKDNVEWDNTVRRLRNVVEPAASALGAIRPSIHIGGTRNPAPPAMGGEGQEPKFEEPDYYNSGLRRKVRRR